MKRIISILLTLTVFFAVNFQGFAQELTPSQKASIRGGMLPNPSFESGKAGWSNNGVGTFTITTTASEQYDNKQAAKIVLSSQTLNFTSNALTTTGLSGVQGTVIVAYIFPAGITTGNVCAVIDTVEQTCISSSQLINDGKYHDIEIPVIFGTSSVQIKLKTTAAATGTVFADAGGINVGTPKQSVAPITESISYTGYSSKSGSNIKFLTKSYYNNSTILSDDNTTYTKFTVLRRSNVVVSYASQFGTSRSDSVITQYSSSGAAKKSTEAFYPQSGDAGGANAVTLTGLAEAGDYFIASESVATPTNATSTNFSITAMPVDTIDAYSNPSVRYPVVLAYSTATTSITSANSAVTVIKYANELVDSANAYDTSTGLFTCPSTRKFNVTAGALGQWASGAWSLAIHRNLSRVAGGPYIGGQVTLGSTVTGTVNCTQGDTISIRGWITSGSATATFGSATADENYLFITPVIEQDFIYGLLNDVVYSKVATKTSAYTATVNDEYINLDATSAAFTITLPPAASHTGKRYTFKKLDTSANAVTIDANGSETIDQNLTWVIGGVNNKMQIVSNGSNWNVVEMPFSIVKADTSGTTINGTGATTTIVFTEREDSENIFSSGSTYTCPDTRTVEVTSFVYAASASGTATAGANSTFELRKGGVVAKYLDAWMSPATTPAYTRFFNGSATVDCTAGETLTLSITNGDSFYILANGATNTWVTFKRIK